MSDFISSKEHMHIHNKSQVGFFVGCKYNPKHDVINRCVKSIKKFHPDHPDCNIVVVDSDSKDTSYGHKLKFDYNIIFDEIKNKYYTTGMIWHAYLNYNYDFYFFLHDSVEVNSCLYDLIGYNIVPLMYWDMQSGKIGWWDSGRQRDWVISQFNLTNIEFKEYDVSGIFGPMFGISRELLNKLYNKKFHKILPTNKELSCGMERAWGIAISQEGFRDEMRNNAINGPYRGHAREQDRIKKYWLNRY